MASFGCSVSASPKPPCRATCPHEGDVRDHRGGLFLRNEAMAFGLCEYVEQRAGEDAGLQGHSYAAQLKRSAAAQIAIVRVGYRAALGQPRPILNVRRIILRSAQRDRGVMHRAASVSSSSRRALGTRSGAVLPIRSPPHQAWVAIAVAAGQTRDVALVLRRARFHHAGT